jgi:hypothetical protein
MPAGRPEPLLEGRSACVLDNDLPQTGHVLVWRVCTEGHRALPFLCDLWRLSTLNFIVIFYDQIVTFKDTYLPLNIISVIFTERYVTFEGAI